MFFRTSAVVASALVFGVTASALAQRVVRLPERDRPIGGHITTVYGIGAMEGRSWEMLNNAEQAAFDRADNLYVLDRGNARVLVFDRNGRFVRQLGKKGGGPGELEVPVALAVLRDGSVAVLDLAHQNFSLFGADGRFQRTVPWRREWGFPGRELAADPRGGAVLALLRPGLTPQLVRGGSVRQNQVITRVSLAGGGAPARLFEIPDLAVARTSSSGPGQVNFRVMGPPEFSPLTLWGALPNGGIALTHTQLYTVKVLDANGRVVRLIQRPVPVRRPTARDRERA
ncbi:MAG TPA: 6-bladed beta-propeller, partial [Longimicrobium sp.]